MRLSLFVKISAVFVLVLFLHIAAARADVYVLGGGGGGGGGSDSSFGGYGGGGAGGYIGTTDYHHPMTGGYPNRPAYRGGDGEDGGYYPAGPGGGNSYGLHSGQGGGAGSGPGTADGSGGQSGYNIGAAYYGGAGGAGGYARAGDSHMAVYFNEGDKIYVLGGSGGTASYTADGGRGGDASLIWHATGMHAVDSLYVMAGSHGQGSSYEEGGRPGGAVFEMLDGSLTITGGLMQISSAYAEARAELLSIRVTNGGAISINSGANVEVPGLSNAVLKLHAGGAALVSNGEITVSTVCQSDAGFVAENAESIHLTGPGRGIRISNNSWNTPFGANEAAKALFYAPRAVVSLDNANLELRSGTTQDNPNSSAVFIAKEVHVGGTGANGNIILAGGAGSTRMEISGAQVSVANTLSVSTDNNSVTFLASNASLRAGTITVNKGGAATGEVAVDVNRLDVTRNDTVLDISGTSAAFSHGTGAGVYFGLVELGGVDDPTRRTLDASRAALGAYRMGWLTVNGLGNPANSQQWVGDLRAGAAEAVGAMHFNLPNGFNPVNYADGGTGTILSIAAGTGNLYLEPGTKVSMAAYPGHNPFKDMNPGDKFQLALADLVQDNLGAPLAGQTISLGARDYRFGYSVNSADNALLATLLGNNNVSPAYLEPGIAALGGLNLLADLEMRTMNNTFDPYVNSTAFGPDGVSVDLMFGAEYTHSRFNSGSHVDSDNFNFVVGPAWRFKNEQTQTGVTIFGEGGYGDFSTYNNFSGLKAVGDGTVKYIGGGIGARLDHLSSGFYGDASARAGAVSFDQDLRDRIGAKYDADTAYYGAHLGIGKITVFSEENRLDTYLRVLWTHIEGDDVTTDASEDLEIDDLDSIAARLGARYSRALTESVVVYAGAAGEYEFDGKACGSLDGRTIGDEPELRGMTGIGELGVKFNAGDQLSIDLGVQGYVGKHEGVGGTAMLTYSF